MGRETKFGLLVGVVFIVLFGVILSSRAGSAGQEHAPLPVGESEGHRKMARSINRTVNPFVQDGTLVIHGLAPTPVPGAVEPEEESLPAPERLPSEDPEPAERDDRGTVAFGPGTVETPMGEATPDGGDVEGQVVFAAPGPAPSPEEVLRRVHTVRPGENLTVIARQYYGKEGERLWRRVWGANKATVPDPHRLAAGQKLVIPPLPTGVRPAAPDVLIAEGRAPRPSDGDRRDPVREVTADDLARMLGNQSDLLEQQPKMPATYTVRKGDTFYRIATNLYGDGRLARLLVLRNKHLVPDETKLRIGQRIVLLAGVEARPAGDLAVARR